MSGLSSRAILVPNYRARFVWLDLGCKRWFDSSLELGIENILRKMEQENSKTITFYISGLGGDFYAFLKLHHFFRTIRSPVVFVPFGKVKSGCFFITQSGQKCLALPGTKFEFHHAVDDYLLKDTGMIMSQLDYATRMDKLKLIDAMQVLLFTQRGRPISKIMDLFAKEATVNVSLAKQTQLLDGVFDKRRFWRDKKFVDKYVSKNG